MLPSIPKGRLADIIDSKAKEAAESTGKCKNRHSFCSRRLLMIQTFVFARAMAVFCCTPTLL